MLVSVGENKRAVSYVIPAASADADTAERMATEHTTLTQAIRVTFKDILLPGQEFFLQIKNEEWGGTFLDLMNEKVADQSVIRAVLKTVIEVSTLAYRWENEKMAKRLLVDVYEEVSIW